MSRKTWTDEKLTDLVANNTSMRQVIFGLGINYTGGNFANIKRNILRLELDMSHWLGQGHLKGKTHNWTPEKPIEEIFIKNSETATSVIRRKVLKYNLLPYVCECGNSGEWLGKSLTLQLDHINGVYNDHRLENLRFLCPNCHTQTETHGSKNFRRVDKLVKSDGLGPSSKEKNLNGSSTLPMPTKCLNCYKEISRYAIRCKKCSGIENNSNKIEWPDTDYLYIRSQDIGFSALGRELGVSDNAIRKRIKRH